MNNDPATSLRGNPVDNQASVPCQASSSTRFATLSFSGTCFACLASPGVYKPVRAKRSRFVPAQDGLAIVADSEIPAVQGRYKEYLCPSVLKRLLRYMQSDRCPLSSFVCNRLTPFHGDNTGSNPVGDAKILKDLRNHAM
jgi:hypothetical protein